MYPRLALIIICLLCSHILSAQKRVYKIVESRLTKLDTFSVYFEVSDFSLNKLAQKKLDSIGTILKGNEKINLYGFTDQRGENNTNLSLSQNRIAAVKTYLLSKGLQDSNLISHNQGVQQSANTETALGKCRRVDLIINSSLPCPEQGIKEQLHSFYYRFEYIQMEDSVQKKFNNIINALLKNRCMKAIINTHKICVVCQMKDRSTAQNLDMEKIEPEATAEGRKEELYNLAIAKGVNKNQLEVRVANVGCISTTNKLFLMGSIEDIYIHQLRVDIKLLSR
jgi:hypothetical protein